jgi:ABC-type oligopeptide transport system substrate-binding subunit
VIGSSVILSRRDVLQATALSAFTLPLKAGRAQAKASQALPWKHGVRLLGDLKYPASFKQFDYFRDPNVAFEAFKAGVLDTRSENAAKNWATGMTSPPYQKAGSYWRNLRSGASE